MTITAGVLAISGAAMSVSGNLASGQAAKEQGAAKQIAANYSAAALDQQAGQVRAQTSAQVAEQARQTQLILSSGRARAASSGAGATDPTVVGLEGGVAGRGEYNNLSLLYSGNEKATGMENQANLDRFTGQQDYIAGKEGQQTYDTKAVTSAISGASSMYSKYG